MARYDTPAFVEHIKKETGVKKMSYIAHSQGAQEMLYNLVKNATYYEENINFLTLLSGYFEIEDTAFLGATAINLARLGVPRALLTGDYGFTPPEWRPLLIGAAAYLPNFFALLQRYTVAATTEYNDPVGSMRFFGYYPAGASIYNWLAVADGMSARALVDKDHGSAEANVQAYGQATPPTIHLSELPSKVTKLPIFMANAEHDLIIRIRYSRRTRDAMKEKLTDYMEVPGGHNIWMIGSDVSAWQGRIIEHLSKYNKLE